MIGKVSLKWTCIYRHGCFWLESWVRLVWVSYTTQVAPVPTWKGNSSCAWWNIFVLGCARMTPMFIHPISFIELLGCTPSDYNAMTITETWFRWLPIQEISQVRLRLLHRCWWWGLLYQARISGSCWIDRLRRTWVARVEKSGQQLSTMKWNGEIIIPYGWTIKSSM